MKTLNNNHVLNVGYHQSFDPAALNKIFYSLFTAGVIEGTFTFTSNTVTISSVSFLIQPQNQTDLLVRIDTTEPITTTNNSSSNIYLVARYRWENENVGADFLFVDNSTIVGTDVILVGLTIDTNGNISSLNYDVQEQARLKVIQQKTAFPLISKVDGYAVGHENNTIPVSDGVINTNLNAQYLNGKEISQYVVSKQLPIITTGSDEIEILTMPTLPDWMDSEAVDLGKGVTAEILQGQKIQPQDGTTEPGLFNQIPVANMVLQKNLNTEFLGGHLEAEFSKNPHQHTLDDILDDGNISVPNYYRIVAVKSNLATADSIEEDDIDFTKVGLLSYDATIGNWGSPIYETGTVILTGVTEQSVSFHRTGGIKNARVILQRALVSAEPAAGTEKRMTKITEITNSGFKCQQLGSIIKSGSDYKRTDASDAAANQYFYFCIGRA